MRSGILLAFQWECWYEKWVCECAYVSLDILKKGRASERKKKPMKRDEEKKENFSVVVYA